jgi:hypothetical protein
VWLQTRDVAENEAVEWYSSFLRAVLLETKTQGADNSPYFSTDSEGIAVNHVHKAPRKPHGRSSETFSKHGNEVQLYLASHYMDNAEAVIGLSVNWRINYSSRRTQRRVRG